MYLSLNHIVAMFSHFAHKASDIDDAIGLQLSQAGVDADHGATATYTCTAVDKDGPHSWWIGGVDSSQEVEERSGEFGGPVVRPLGVVELEDNMSLR